MQLVHDGKLIITLFWHIFHFFFSLRNVFWQLCIFVRLWKSFSIYSAFNFNFVRIFWLFFLHTKNFPHNSLEYGLHLMITSTKSLTCWYHESNVSISKDSNTRYIVDDNWLKSKYFIKVCIIIRWENSTRQQRDREEETFTTEYEWRHWSTSSDVALQKSTHR